MLNEGLAVLGRYDSCYDEDSDEACYEVFEWSGLEEIVLPSTLEKIGRRVFLGCGNLKTVCVKEGCALDIGKYVGDGVEVRYE